MHETHLIEPIIQGIAAHAQREGAQTVLKVRLKVGDLTGVSEESFRNTFSMLAKDTLLEKADLDGMINLGRSVDGVEISAMFRLEPEGHVKVSFRSKGQVDVADLAAQFGGGGHKAAAGAHLTGPVEQAKGQVFDAVAEQLG